MTQNNFFKWITFPPVIAIATIMLARTMRGGNIVGEVDISLWGLTWICFIIASVLYALFIVHGFNAGIIPLQALAQGILLCPMSIVYGARMFQWLGVIIAVCGAAALVAIYNQTENERKKVVIVDSENDVKKMPLNFVITDDTGAILNLTDDMLKVLDIDRINTVGQNISEWFSPVSKTAEINEKIWDIQRKGFDNGRRFLFELKPKALPTSESDNSEGQVSSDNAAFIDPDTQLYTYRYGIARISDELYRAGRYNHPVTAVMLRLVFPQLLPDEDMEKYIRPFRAYCNRIMKDIRQSDTAIQTGESQILITLSECPYQMAENIIERLTSIINALAPTFEEFLHVNVLNVHETFENSNDIPTAQELVERITRSMTRKYSANALSQ